MTPNEQPEVRVIASSRCTDDGTRQEMIGKEYKVETIDYSDNSLRINSLWFNFSDVQWLTPLSFNGRRIAVGDSVKWCGEWCEVQTFVNCTSEVELVVKGANGAVWAIRLVGVSNHRTPQDTTITELTLDDVAKKFGVDVKSLRIKE